MGIYRYPLDNSSIRTRVSKSSRGENPKGLPQAPDAFFDGFGGLGGEIEAEVAFAFGGVGEKPGSGGEFYAFGGGQRQ